MSRNNRTAGHRFETETITLLRESGLFPHAVSCRSENRTRDGQKVDIINRDEGVNGRMEYNIQCKNSSLIQHYARILKEMPVVSGVMNVIFHKFTKKAGSRFITQGKYALTTQDDFLELAKYRRGYDILSKHAKDLPIGMQSQIQSELQQIGLQL